MKLAKNLERLGTETAFSVLAEAKKLEAQGKEMIHLGLGQPDFKTPQHIMDAAKKAIDDGHHGYVLANGITECREAVSRKIKSLYKKEVSPERILPFSTGVIMTRLPVENIKKSIPNLVKGLNENNWLEAAKAIMTTDTLPKAVSKSIFIQDQKVTITGISKGAGMIHPKMATMLAFISTDAHISIEMLQKLNQEITDTTFNCISVDGDSSTNDSFITVASNKSKHSKIVQEDADYKVLKSAFFDIALELAQAIIRDGEGATKFITIKVLGGNSLKECNEIGMSIAKSPLVKTAFFASDPNLGRIFAAIGNSNLKNLDISLIDLYINEILFASEGAVAKGFDEEVIQKEMNKSEINLKVDLNNGIHKSTIWTTDLSYEYIKINAEYRT